MPESVGNTKSPYVKRQAMEQVFYFCPKDACLWQAPSWSNNTDRDNCG